MRTHSNCNYYLLLYPFALFQDLYLWTFPWNPSDDPAARTVAFRGLGMSYGREWHPEPVEVGSLSQLSTRFYTYQAVVWDFWSINSIFHFGPCLFCGAVSEAKMLRWCDLLIISWEVSSLPSVFKACIYPSIERQSVCFHPPTYPLNSVLPISVGDREASQQNGSQLCSPDWWAYPPTRSLNPASLSSCPNTNTLFGHKDPTWREHWPQDAEVIQINRFKLTHSFLMLLKSEVAVLRWTCIWSPKVEVYFLM